MAEVHDGQTRTTTGGSPLARQGVGLGPPDAQNLGGFLNGQQQW